ncbi:MAG: YqaJ viral recombinase family protein [Eubacteriales bacterium]
MHKVVDTRTISHEEWLQYRKQGLTGTDAGAITGMNPFSSAFKVYQDKITDEIETFDNESMRQGRDLEDYVAQRFMEAMNLKVRRTNAIYAHDEYPFLMGNFDRIVVGEKAGLECKTVGAYSADKWKDGNIPLHYQLQCQHYLAVSGFKSWYIAALVLGRELIIHKLERDEELIQNLISIEKKFWEENVLARVIPEPDGSDNYTQMIGKLYGIGKLDKEVLLPELKDELERRAELVELEEKIKTEKEQIDQRVKMQMQDATYAKSAQFQISWKNSETKRLDGKRLKEENPELYEGYCKTTNSRRFLVKKVA